MVHIQMFCKFVSSEHQRNKVIVLKIANVIKVAINKIKICMF